MPDTIRQGSSSPHMGNQIRHSLNPRPVIGSVGDSCMVRAFKLGKEVSDVDDASG